MDNQSIVIVVSPSSPYGRPSVTMTQGNVRAVYVGDADSGAEFEVCTARFQLAYLKSRGSQNREAKKRHVRYTIVTSLLLHTMLKRIRWRVQYLIFKLFIADGYHSYALTTRTFAYPRGWPAKLTATSKDFSQ